MKVMVNLEDLKSSFEDLPDPRVEGRTLHRLEDILFLTLCAVICGMEDWESIAEWGEESQDWLRGYVGLENGIPSHDTISRVFSLLEAKKFQECFTAWMRTLCPSLRGEVVAVDGKTVRGSHHRRLGKSAIHVVSAFVCGQGITLGQCKTEEKSNEITAIPELIDALELSGATITLDAMGCQKEIVKTIIDKQANYVISLKGNQSTLHEQVKAYFDQTQWQNYKDFADWGHRTEEKGHGRKEVRRCIALAYAPTASQEQDWKDLRTVAMVESMQQTSEGVSSEKRYFISSLAPDSEKLAQVIRSHWEVETRLHWCLDVTFHEDASRIRRDHAPENFNIIKKIAINLLRLDPTKKTLPKKRLKACLNKQYLAEILGAPS